MLRLLYYIKSQKNLKKPLEIQGEKVYYIINFRLIDFMYHINENDKNHRQRTNILQIFQDL